MSGEQLNIARDNLQRVISGIVSRMLGFHTEWPKSFKGVGHDLGLVLLSNWVSESGPNAPQLKTME